MKRKKSSSLKTKIILAGLFLSATNSFAQDAPAQPAEVPSVFPGNEFYLIAGGILILLLVIYSLGKTAVGLGKAVSKTAKKSSATIILLLISAVASSQSESPLAQTPIEFPAWASNPNVYMFGFLFFIMLLSAYVLYTVNMKLIKAISPAAVEVPAEALEAAFAKEKKPRLLRRLYLRLIDSVPVAKEKDILLDHDYDGIKELDNNLPPWWKYGFYFTIIFAFFYLLIYHVSGVGKLQGEEYKDELLFAQKQKEERMKAGAENVNEENVVALTDAEPVTKGKETFQKLCIACHRADGGGQVGPNLTDEYWLHGGGIKNIFKTITYGVPGKGMLSWQSQLSPKQIQQVASYVLTLKGTNPPGPKEPQGDKWVEENVVPADSTHAKAITDSTKIALSNSITK
jgi:cytochrome c oxidase cbb3-type subunit 3